MTQNPYGNYQQTAVQTASPERLLIMLFDGAIKFGNQAKTAIAAKDVNNSHKYLIKTEDIISELMSTLDMNYSISKNLYSLYEYMNDRLAEANLKKDLQPVEEVLGYLSELRDTFSKAAIKAKAQSAVTGNVNFQG